MLLSRKRRSKTRRRQGIGLQCSRRHQKAMNQITVTVPNLQVEAEPAMEKEQCVPFWAEDVLPR